MKSLIFAVTLGFTFIAHAEDLDVAMAQKVHEFSAQLQNNTTDLNQEWFLYRRTLRFSVTGQVSIGIARVELTPEVEIIQER